MSTPCWWGTHDRHHNWDEARQFLEQFSSIEKASFNISTQPGATSYVAFFPSPFGDDATALLITVVDNIVQIIRIEPETAYFASLSINCFPTMGYLLSPVRQTKSYDDDYLWYTVVLLYQDMQFLAICRFSGPISGNPVKLCLDFGPTIDIWSPAEAWTLHNSAG